MIEAFLEALASLIVCGELTSFSLKDRYMWEDANDMMREYFGSRGDEERKAKMEVCTSPTRLHCVFNLTPHAACVLNALHLQLDRTVLST